MQHGGGGTGAAIASLPELGGLFFTGSNATGRRINQVAASQLVKVQLELGGKDPVYVRRDVVSVRKAAEALADGAFYNCGQSCCSVERIYVDASVVEEFVGRFREVVRKFRVGDPSREDTFIGPLTRTAQVGVLRAQLEDAVSRGARVETGGDMKGVSGNFFPPTVLTGVDHTMSVMREESFGPIIGIQAVEGDEEALRLMADTSYGLTAGVYCGRQEDAESILRELDVGSAYWNCCDRSVPRLPWSGRKGSGMGCTLGLDGMRAFVQPKGYHLQTP